MVNKVIIIGHLGQDPVMNKSVANVSIATSKTWKDKSGEKQSRTEWHKVVFFEKLAEIAFQYLNKGSKVYVEGELKTEEYVDKKDGIKRRVTKIIASSLQMLDSKADSNVETKTETKTEIYGEDVPF